MARKNATENVRKRGRQAEDAKFLSELGIRSNVGAPTGERLGVKAKRFEAIESAMAKVKNAKTFVLAPEGKRNDILAALVDDNGNPIKGIPVVEVPMKDQTLWTWVDRYFADNKNVHRIVTFNKGKLVALK